MSWHDPDREDTTIYKVVVNHEEQYSIWPEYKENPLGWKDVGKVGPKAECLAHINSPESVPDSSARGSRSPTPDMEADRPAAARGTRTRGSLQ